MRCFAFWRVRAIPERALAGFLVGSMATAPAAELAHLDPLRIVAPVLVRLVVAPLAVLASKRYRDSDVSASHSSDICPVGISSRHAAAISMKNTAPASAAAPKNSACVRGPGRALPAASCAWTGIDPIPLGGLSAGQAQLPRLRAAPRACRGVVLAVVGLFIALLAYGLSTKAPDDSIDQSLADGARRRGSAVLAGAARAGALPGRAAAGFARAAADGRIGLEELRGSPVVLNLWASWCSPCRDEAAALERGWRQLGPAGRALPGPRHAGPARRRARVPARVRRHLSVRPRSRARRSRTTTARRGSPRPTSSARAGGSSATWWGRFARAARLRSGGARSGRVLGKGRAGRSGRRASRELRC